MQADEVARTGLTRGLPLVLTVPEASLWLGLGRGAAYSAVARGEIPSVRIGRRIVVPTQRLLAMLGVDKDSTENDS